MKLSEYLSDNHISALAFAQRIGRAPSTVTRLLTGKHTPDAATMRAIIDATGGSVTPNDFFDLPPLDDDPHPAPATDSQPGAAV